MHNNQSSEITCRDTILSIPCAHLEQIVIQDSILTPGKFLFWLHVPPVLYPSNHSSPHILPSITTHCIGPVGHRIVIDNLVRQSLPSITLYRTLFILRSTFKSQINLYTPDRSCRFSPTEFKHKLYPPSTRISSTSTCLNHRTSRSAANKSLKNSNVGVLIFRRLSIRIIALDTNRRLTGSQDDSEIEPKTEPEVPVAREAQINTPPIPTVSPSTVSIAPTTTTIVSLQAPVLPEPSGSIVDTEEWGASAMPKSMTAPVMPSHISSHSSRTTAASRATAASRRLSTDPTLRFHEIARSLKDYTSAQSLSEVRSHQNPVKKLEGGCVSGLGLSIHIVRENDEPVRSTLRRF